MSANIRIIETEDFIRAQPDGTLDRGGSLALLRSLVGKLGAGDDYQVLVDTRKADVALSTADIFEIGNALAAEAVLRSRRVAVLARENDLDAEFFELVSRNRGANLRSFTDFESAINWLILRPVPHSY